MTVRDDGVVLGNDLEVAREHLDRVAERCYRDRARQLYGFGRRLGLDHGGAEEVVQEAFVRLLRGGAIPPNPDAWLFRTIRNLAIDRHRRAMRRLPTLPLAEAVETDADTDEAIVWNEVDRLPERQRAAIYLRYRADLDFASIGRVLQISESGARANVFRALSQLRERMEER